MQSVLMVIFNHNGQNLGAILMQHRNDVNNLTGYRCMNRSADETACLCNHLTHVDDVTLLHQRLCRCANVHRNRKDDLVRCLQDFDRLCVCCGFESRIVLCSRMDTATKRVRHYGFTSLFILCGLPPHRRQIYCGTAFLPQIRHDHPAYPAHPLNGRNPITYIIPTFQR